MFILFCLFDLNCRFFVLFRFVFFLYMVFLRNKNGLWLLKQTPFCQGGKEAFGLTERSFSVKSNSSAARTARLRAFVGEFCFSFGPEGGPGASSCPAVLGDVDPCGGVYECVTFTLFALMYITMSEILKIYFE